MIEIKNQDDLAVVKFRDSTLLTRNFSDELEPALLPLLDQSEKNVIINMSSISHIDSYGIGLVITLFKKMVGKNNRVVFSDISGQVLFQVKMLGLDRVFTIFETENEALSSVAH